MERINRKAALIGLLGVTVVLFIASLFFGPANLSPGDVLQAILGMGDTMDSIIVRDLRLPRAILAFLVGAALAGAGVVFQGLFRNPLADPFVVGVSGGAALGAVLAIVLGATFTFLGASSITLCGFIGGLGAAALVYQLSAVRGRVPVTTLLLAGFAVGAFASALVSILMLLDKQNWNQILQWLLGNLDHPDAWLRIKLAFPFIVAALAVIGYYSRDLNVMLMGDEAAQHLGVEVEWVKKVLLAAGTIATAAAVAMCGIIGFVGLIVPHIVRLVVGPDHRTLLPVTILAGGAFLVFADILARVVLPPSGLPVGTVTALAGAPFFLILLRKRSRQL